MRAIVFVVVAFVLLFAVWFYFCAETPPKPLPQIVEYRPKCNVEVITMRDASRLRAQLPDARFYPAVDGKSAPLSQLREYLSESFYKWFSDNPKYLGHLGCAMSHMFLWRKIVESGVREPTLILEDDAILTGEFGKIDELLQIAHDYDVLFFGGSCGYQTPKCHLNDGARVNHGLVRVNYMIGLWGYVVPDARAALTLLNACAPLHLPVDHQISSDVGVRKMLAMPTLVDHPGIMRIDSFGYETRWDFSGYKSLTNS